MWCGGKEGEEEREEEGRGGWEGDRRKEEGERRVRVRVDVTWLYFQMDIQFLCRGMQPYTDLDMLHKWHQFLHMAL